MPKHKKTKEQKKLSDARKSIALRETPLGHIHTPPTYAFSAKTAYAQRPVQTGVIDVTSIVKRDLLKTGIISFCILALQIIFFVLLKNHMLAISFASY